MKIAFVHEYLNQYGGAERVLQVLCSMFPNAPIYTLVYDARTTGGVFEGRVIRTSFLQKLPLAARQHYLFSALMPLAIERFDLSSFDLVLSISASFAKGIITHPKVRHICYCLTPPRFLWDGSQRFVQEFHYPSILKSFVPPLVSYLRVWDKQACGRVNEFVSISKFVRDRVFKYYNRDSSVIYPPVNITRFNLASLQEIRPYFLMVGRLVTYKKFDLAIQTCNKLGVELKIVGDGIDAGRLTSMAGPTVEFIRQVGDEKLAELYAHAQALIFPQEEDFGIVPLEAMASGRPVIAYRSGGATETVIENETGIFFDQQNENSLAEAIERFGKIEFDPNVCRAQAEKFDISIFENNIMSVLSSKI